MVSSIWNGRLVGLTFLFGMLYALGITEHLTAFPIYFFCDEAIHGVEAHNILTRGRDMYNRLFPILFQGFGDFQLSLSIYLQIPFVALFGLSENTVRLSNAAYSLVGVLAMYAWVRHFAQSFLAWIVFPILYLSPVWFLHSRTAFEALPSAAFFMAMLYWYCRARAGENLGNWIWPICAGFCFYLYTPARGWVLVSVALLCLVDCRYHFRNWRRTLTWAGLLFLCLSPYIIFQTIYPDLALRRFESVGLRSFLALNASEKISKLLTNYGTALDPRLWFTWSGTSGIESVERHIIPKLSSLPIWLLPFTIWGALRSLYQLKIVHQRALWIALIACPLPAALTQVTLLRCLPVACIYMLWGVLGLSHIWNWSVKSRIVRDLSEFLLAGVLISLCLVFRDHVFNKAPYLYRDYRFYGVQYGAPQLFNIIKAHIVFDNQIILASNLFNAGSIFVDFYLSPEERKKVRVLNPEVLCNITEPNHPTWVLPIDLLDSVVKDKCEPDFRKVTAIHDPNGKEIMLVLSDLRPRLAHNNTTSKITEEVQ